MAHSEQLNFIQSIKDQHPKYFTNQKVLEIGSYNVNGSVRQFFEGGSFLGIDVAEGKDVDLVCNGESYDAPDNSYDVVISCECMEHNPKWIETFSNMIRLVKSGGMIIMTCATTGRAEHGTTRTTPLDSPLTIGLGWDYYENRTFEDFNSNFNFREIFENHQFVVNVSSHDLYFLGVKK